MLDIQEGHGTKTFLRGRGYALLCPGLEAGRCRQRPYQEEEEDKGQGWEDRREWAGRSHCRWGAGGGTEKGTTGGNGGNPALF